MNQAYRAELVSFEGNPSRKINAMGGHQGILFEVRTAEGLILYWVADLSTEDVYTLRTSAVLSVENQRENFYTYRTANSVYVFRLARPASAPEAKEALSMIR